QTLYSLRAAKVYLYNLLARNRCRAVSKASQSFRKSGLGSLIASAPKMKIVL
ncbi:hypothetical protein COCC4DRAFT_142338, partial [Bipolaris maydis ATCC 48331]